MKAPLTSISNSCALCLLTPTALPISDDVALVRWATDIFYRLLFDYTIRDYTPTYTMGK